MTKFNVPKREFCDGEKKPVTFRLPVKLYEALKKEAQALGWDATEVVVTVLDQFLQTSKKKSESK